MPTPDPERNGERHKTSPPHREQRSHVVGDLADFPPGSHKVVRVGGRQIGVFNIVGTLYALPNLCPHQTGPLCETKRMTGTLESTAATGWLRIWVRDGEIVTCPWHGLEYHVPTGQCLAFPEIRLRTYDVKVEGNVVMVSV
jgi:nitrite reductase (NADH) small subunit